MTRRASAMSGVTGNGMGADSGSPRARHNRRTKPASSADSASKVAKSTLSPSGRMERSSDRLPRPYAAAADRTSSRVAPSSKMRRASARQSSASGADGS